jgi:MFS family permease
LLFIGAFCGALVSSFLINKFGLGKSFLISSLIICISLLMAFISKLIDSAELFILHRFANGLGVGVITTVQTVYLAEISPVRYRGFMGTLTGFSTSIGFVVASAIGLPQVFGQAHLWQWSYIVGKSFLFV